MNLLQPKVMVVAHREILPYKVLSISRLLLPIDVDQVLIVPFEGQSLFFIFDCCLLFLHYLQWWAIQLYNGDVENTYVKTLSIVNIISKLIKLESFVTVEPEMTWRYIFEWYLMWIIQKSVYTCLRVWWWYNHRKLYHLLGALHNVLTAL